MVKEMREVDLGVEEKSCSPWFRMEKCIRGRKHLSRRHGVKYDVYFALRYTFRNVLHEEGEGWASQGMTLDKARADLREIKEGQRTGKGPFTLKEKREREELLHEQERRALQAVAERKTLAMLWEEYEKENSHKSGIRSDRSIYKYLKPLYFKFPEDIITQDVTNIVQAMRQSDKSEQTIVHMKELVRRLLNYGEKKGWLVKPPRWQLEIVVPQVDNIKTECLNAEQLLRLKEGLDKDPDQQLADVMRLALVTGMRRGALLGLQWEDLNFELNFIVLRGAEAKNGKTVAIPMSKSAREILLHITKTESPYVFPGKKGGKRSDLNKFYKRIKEYLPPHFRPLHGLRHTYASVLISSGAVDIYTLQKLLTHESDVTKRYAHLSDQAMARGASVADSAFMRVTSASPADSKALPDAVPQKARRHVRPRRRRP